MTPSTVSLARMSGQSNALTSGFGSARPEVSMMMWSGRGSRASRPSMAGRKSSATVQQMQPLASSTILSSGQDSTPQDLQDLAVDADIAEFVDDQREPPAARIGQHVADQRGLAGAEEAGDDGDGNFREAHGSGSGTGARRSIRHPAEWPNRDESAPPVAWSV